MSVCVHVCACVCVCIGCPPGAQTDPWCLGVNLVLKQDYLCSAHIHIQIFSSSGGSWLSLCGAVRANLSQPITCGSCHKQSTETIPPLCSHGLIPSIYLFLIIALKSTVFIVHIYEEPSGHPLRVAVDTINLQRLSPPSVSTV